MTRWTPDSQKRVQPLADSTGMWNRRGISNQGILNCHSYHSPLWLGDVDYLSTAYKGAKPLSHDLPEEDSRHHIAKAHPRHRSFNSGFSCRYLHHFDAITASLGRSCCPHKGSLSPKETVLWRTVSGQALPRRLEKALQRHIEGFHEIFPCHPNSLVLYSHDQLYKHIGICMQNHNDDTIKTTTQFVEKYTSHFIWKGCVWEGVGDRTEQQHIDLLTLMAISVSFPFSRVVQPEARGPNSARCWLSLPHLVSKLSDLQTLSGVLRPLLPGAGFLYRILSSTGLVPKLTDFLSSPSYIIVQSSTQYLPITGHRNVSLLPSLEWHVLIVIERK